MMVSGATPCGPLTITDQRHTRGSFVFTMGSRRSTVFVAMPHPRSQCYLYACALL